VLRDCPLHEQLSEPLQYALGVQLPFHVNRQALPRVLVNDPQQAEGPALVGTVMHEVVGPDVILALGP